MRQLPPILQDRLKAIFGQQTDQVIKTFIERPTTFRINTLKARREDILETLQQEGFKLRRVPWYGDAFILENKKLSELQKLPIYTQGKIYVQSLASMVPPIVLNPKPGDKVLDLTAAPGSKTSQMAAIMKNQGELIANDNNEIRVERLKHNLKLLGADSVVVTFEDGWKLEDKYKEHFDKILLDAPCTAEARIIVSEPRTYSFWNEKNIKEHAFIQRKLIFAAWMMLKPGGTLVYSTCTFAPEENEKQVARFLEDVGELAELEVITLPQLSGGRAITEWKGEKLNQEVKKSLRLLPSKDIEGFYIAKIKKVV